MRRGEHTEHHSSSQPMDLQLPRRLLPLRHLESGAVARVQAGPHRRGSHRRNQAHHGRGRPPGAQGDHGVRLPRSALVRFPRRRVQRRQIHFRTHDQHHREEGEGRPVRLRSLQALHRHQSLPRSMLRGQLRGRERRRLQHQGARGALRGRPLSPSRLRSRPGRRRRDQRRIQIRTGRQVGGVLRLCRLLHAPRHPPGGRPAAEIHPEREGLRGNRDDAHAVR
mmetsp:Transcript_30100/g.62935  ORF Transcript_30100/g.62935 Transcript_30100/m.62935 type:complete len:223 (+) Transcript_30100:395-1063(+)